MSENRGGRETLPIIDKMIIGAAKRLNGEKDCGFVLRWMQETAGSVEAREAVTEAALRLHGGLLGAV